METKHTLGPWKQCGHLIVMDTSPFKNGGCICSMEKRKKTEVPTDARLIAAAPELLESLQILVKQGKILNASEQDKGNGAAISGYVLDNARKALAKAGIE